MKWLDSRDPDFPDRFAALIESGRSATAAVEEKVAAILAAVRERGDAALVELTTRYDGWQPDTAAALRISEDEIATAESALDERLRAALDLAAARIAAFHRAQLPQDLSFCDEVGLRMGLRWTPLEAVGLYVPGGKAAYPSSVLMNAIPARIAGVPRLAMCVPTPGGVLSPLVLAAAKRAGISEIYRIGGAQAIAALAFGTESIAPVDRIIGPGNAFVAEAKRQVFGRVGIDAVAGPSEVVIIADSTNDPAEVAIDLLAQAEHDEEARALLLTPDAALAAAVAEAVGRLLGSLARGAIAARSWQRHGAVIIVSDLAEAAALANRLAPEHLQLMVAEPQQLFAQIRHAGAVFLGRFCPEALGDYLAGPNHVLPTGGTARFASGLAVYDFLKRTSWIEGGAAALAMLGPAAILLAEAEGLQAHAQSLAQRLGQGGKRALDPG